MSQPTCSPDLKAQLRSLPSLQGPFPEFSPSQFPPTPQAAFTDWLTTAINHPIPEPHSMTLSTVDSHGAPDARMLLLKNLDAQGFHFATSSTSAKGIQLEGNQDVALTFYWKELGRQVRVRGTAVRLSEQECADDFLARGKGARICAVASRQSQVLESPEELRTGLEDAEELLGRSPGYVKEEWGVYAVAPRMVEFWQGREDRVHQRFEHVLDEADGRWSKRALWP